MLRTQIVAWVVLPLLWGSAACQESDDDRRDAYCEQLRADSPRLTKISDEGGAGAFIEALPILEGLAKKSPSDLKDEWKVFLDSLHGLDEVVEDTGVDPDRIQDKRLPRDLSKDQRRRLRNAANDLRTPEVQEAVRGIEQHAIDICRQPLI